MSPTLYRQTEKKDQIWRMRKKKNVAYYLKLSNENNHSHYKTLQIYNRVSIIVGIKTV